MPSLHRAQQDLRILNRQVGSLLARSARYFPYCVEKQEILFHSNLIFASFYHAVGKEKKIIVHAIFEWIDEKWIIIQAHIRNTDSYSDTDS